MGDNFPDESELTYGTMECMNEIVTARNTEDGSVGQYPRHILDHPILGRYLEEAPYGSKPRKSLQDIVDAGLKKSAPKRAVVELKDESPENDNPEEEEN